MIKLLLLSCLIFDAACFASAGTQVIDAKQNVQASASVSPAFPDFSNVVEKLVVSSVSIVTTTTPDAMMRSQDSEDGGAFGNGSPFEDLFKDFFKNYFDKIRRPQKALGSGFIVKADKGCIYIATNYHVVKGAQKITIIFNDKSKLSGVIHGVDERTDIAVIKVQITGDSKKYIPVSFGDSTALKSGQWVVAIGNPFGLGSTATFGPVSSTGRDIYLPSSGSKKINPYDVDFIQHQAPINVGNSGGMLATLDGLVVGINTAIFTPSGGNVGVGFAIPSYLAKKTIEQLIENRITKRGWIGVTIQPVTSEMAECYGLDRLGITQDKKCVIVNSVSKNGPAEKAGVKEGDIIFSLNGVALTDTNRLSRLVAESDIGKEVKLELIRNRQKITLNIVIQEYETSPIVEQSKKDEKNSAIVNKIEMFGLTLLPVPQDQRLKANIPEGHEGVYVSKIDLQKDLTFLPGDILRSCVVIVGDKEFVVVFKNMSDVNAAIRLIKENKLKNVCFRVGRMIDDKMAEIYLTLSTEVQDEKNNDQEKSDKNLDSNTNSSVDNVLP